MADITTPQRMKATGEIGTYNPFDRSVPVVASTPSPVEGQALTSWDLERFQKNPVVMWSHINPANGIDGSLPIGKFTDITFDPIEGLKGKVTFAISNPLSEKIAGLVQEDFLRAVSVGYEYLGNGRARLIELSFVPIGADEDAGTPALNPNADDDTDGTESLRAKIRNAAADLARQGARLRARRKSMQQTQRTDAADTEVERLDVSRLRLDRVENTPSGGKKIPARLARTGVLMYRDASMPDGWRRELRIDEEQFHHDVMETLDHAPVIDIKHHGGMVTAETWKDAALGSVGSPHADGKFIAATLHVNDRATLDAIERGERSEISLGYRCRLDDGDIKDGVYTGPGVFNGVRADFVQRGLRINHVALCPPNGGRAGNDVGLRLDSNDRQPWAVAHIDEKDEEAMADINTKTIVKTRVDGREYEEFSKEHFDAVERVHNMTLKTLTQTAEDAKKANDAAMSDLQKRLDATKGECDGLKTNLDKARADVEEVKKKAMDDKKSSDEEGGKDLVKKVKRFAKMWRTIERLFGKPKDEKDDEKLDSLIGDERGLMLYAIQKSDQRFDDKDEDGKERSIEYLRSRWDQLASNEEKRDGVSDVVKVIAQELPRVDARDQGEFEANARAIVEAQRASAERLRKGEGTSGSPV